MNMGTGPYKVVHKPGCACGNWRGWTVDPCPDIPGLMMLPRQCERDAKGISELMNHAYAAGFSDRAECVKVLGEAREALSVDPVDGPKYGLCLAIDALIARLTANPQGGGG